MHFVVRLKKDISGERHRILGQMTCEIQLRTVLQDAWAVLDHHFRYKREGQIQKELQRRLHALAAIVETADQQVDEIAARRDRYVTWLNGPHTTVKRLRREPVNDETLLAYLRKKFPELKPVMYPQHGTILLSILDHQCFPTIAEIDDAVDATADARRAYVLSPFSRTGAAQVGLALACVNFDFRKYVTGSPEAKKIAETFKPSSKETG